MTFDQTGDMGYGTRSVVARQTFVTQGNTYLAASGGSVGIGTTAPTSKLHIAGDNVNVFLDGTGNVGAPITEIKMKRGAVSYSLRTGIGGTQNFDIYDNTNSASRLFIGPSGNVGFGITTPGDVVTINGSNGTGGLSIVRPTDSAHMKVFSAPNSSTLRFGGGGQSNIDFYVGTTFASRYDSAGNLGIGTSAPAATLDIQSATDGAESLRIRRQAAPTTQYMSMVENGGDASFTAYSAPSNAKPLLFNVTTNTSNTALTGGQIYMGMFTMGAERMRIDSSGNVGIGTSAPDEKLHVLGNLRVGQAAGTAGVDDVTISHDGATTKFVNNDNNTLATQNNFTFTGPRVGGGTVSFSFDSAGQIVTDYTAMRFVTSGGQLAAVNGNGLSVRSTGGHVWSSDTNPNGVADTGLYRGAAGVVYVGNGTAGTSSGTLIAGNVGVGTTAPGTPLDVVGNTTLRNRLSVNGGSFTDNNGNMVAGIKMDTANKTGIFVTDNFAENSNNNGAFISAVVSNRTNFPNINALALRMTASSTSANTQSASGFAQFIQNVNATGAVNSGNVFSQIQTNGSGINNTGTSYAYTAYNYLQDNGAGATLANFVGYYSRGGVALGNATVTNQYDFRADDFANGVATGGITNRYGLYLGYGTTQTTNAYGVYQTDANVKNYFNGNVGIGTTSPTAKLDITSGNLNLDNTTNANKFGAITKGGTRFMHNFNYGYNGTVTTDGGNTFVGELAGNFTMGSTATISAHASYNNAFGRYALALNTTGYANNAIGQNALYGNTTGRGNTAIGHYAGRYIADGFTANQASQYSIYLGQSTYALASGDTNEIVIGYNTTGLGSNTVVLGNSSITTTALRGNVGIGTTTPTERLHISDQSSPSWYPVRIDAYQNSGGSSGGLVIAPLADINKRIEYASRTDGGFRIFQGTAGTDVMSADASGNVGIGTTTPGYRLHVAGTAAATTFTTLSDARYKQNVAPIADAMNLINQLEGVRYDFNRAAFPHMNFTDKRQMGFIAQQIEGVVPELVTTDARGYKAVNYSQMTALLAEGLKAHDKIVRQFKQEDANTLAVTASVFKAKTVLADELGVKKIKVPVIDFENTFALNDSVPNKRRMVITADGKVGFNVENPTVDFEVGGEAKFAAGLSAENINVANSLSAKTMSASSVHAGNVRVTGNAMPDNGIYAPQSNSVGIAAGNTLIAKFDAISATFARDIVMRDGAGVEKKVIDKEGHLYAANLVNLGTDCAGRDGAIGRDAEGNLFICK